ncbi:PLP-dependent transferase [Cylindrobasidium torrendii FP15055 ss-10]|uniref:PLP-dependent transferase n=1 Tax=Cylindrobasidium torrendii FP15055 ss-10 TaxID=1314674 RepID=A0A0D7BIB4_9AGAR|nr:PLP-dependent transferase [Cylindrobasidium torrendii FP15055 ss-10]
MPRTRPRRPHSSSSNPRPSYRLAYNVPSDATSAYIAFMQEYPEYQMTWLLDSLRETDYTRLEATHEVYADYMGGALYPESLVKLHSEFLNTSVLGNTHSINNSSARSMRYANEARDAVLSFFHAPPEDYTVVFTSNASGALKLVGESFAFTRDGSYILCADSHNSLNGIRQFATRGGAKTIYIPTTSQGGLLLPEARAILLSNAPLSKDAGTSLFALTGQSNLTNAKLPLSLLSHASSLGYSTLLDAAALAPTSAISLADAQPDAMAVSFYKMFGYPTGVGALVVKKSFLELLHRPWFAGGTVEIVQAPGNIVTRARKLHERFEEGTINYLSLPAVVSGLRMLSAYMPFLPLRLSILTHYAIEGLMNIRHSLSGLPVVMILSRRPSHKLHFVGEQADSGSTISTIFVGPSGERLPNSFIEYAASCYNISLRTGCICNPGGASALLHLQSAMSNFYPGITLREVEDTIGNELGVVRFSFGLGSNFWDVWSVLRFVEKLANERTRTILYQRWSDARYLVRNTDS